MPPLRAPRRPGPCGRSLLRALPPAIGLAAIALLAPEWSGATVILIAVLVWCRHHP